MNRLVNIALINWYLFNRTDIHIEGSVAIAADNGAGKSSILDAVQVCLLGADQTAISLNARTEQKKENARTIPAYMLGNVDGKQKRSGDRMFQTYIVMGFKNQNTGEECSIGVMMECHGEGGDFSVEKRFIVPGRVLKTSDLIQPIEGKQDAFKILPWGAVAENCKSFGVEFQSDIANAREYRQRYMRLLNPDLGRRGWSGVSDTRFKRLFKQTIEFSSSKASNVDEFIRRFILNESDTDPARWRERYAAYRAFDEKIKAAEVRREAFEGITQAAALFLRGAQDVLAANLLNDRIAATNEYLRFVKERQHYSDLTALAATADTHAARLANEIESLEDDRGQIEARINASDQSSQIHLLKANIKDTENKVHSARTKLEALRQATLSVLAGLERARAQGISVHHCLTAIASLQAAPIGGDWTIETVSRPVVEALGAINASGISRTIEEKYTQAYTNGSALEHKCKTLADQLKELRGGGDVYPAHVKRTLQDLQAEGISGRVVCTLADVKPEFQQWRRVAETMLGDLCHAVLVAPHQVEQAIAILRRTGAETTIIRTNKIPSFVGAPGNHTLAHVIATKDPQVAALVADRLGRTRRVDTEAELKEVDNGVSSDGMRASGYTIRRLKLTQEQRLYGSDPKALESDLRRRISELEREIDAERPQIVALRQISDAVVKNWPQLPTKAEDMQNVFDTWRSHKNTLGRQERELNELQSAIDPELGRQLEEIRIEIKTRKEELETKNKERADLNQQIGSCKTIYLGHRKNFRGLARSIQRKRISLDPIGMRDLVRQRSQEMADKARIPGHRHAYRIESVDLVRDETLTRYLQNYRNAVGRFQPTHPEDAIPERPIVSGASLSDVWSGPGRAQADMREMPDIVFVSNWAQKRIETIENDVLIPHRQQAKAALEAVIQTAYTSLLQQMANDIQGMKDAIDHLNRSLRTRHFGHDFYKISFERKPEKSALIDLAENLEQNREVFDSGFVENHPEDIRVKALNDLLETLKATDVDAKTGQVPEARLRAAVDYREYYRFDVEIGNINDENGKRRRLSERLGTASGGEHDVPLYICFGMAMAITYFGRVDEVSRQGKSSIVLLDEAFRNLDPSNTRKVIEFYKSLGLQLITAAPGTQRMVYVETMDWIATLQRTDLRAHLRQVSASEEARSLIGDADPIRREAKAASLLKPSIEQPQAAK